MHVRPLPLLVLASLALHGCPMAVDVGSTAPDDAASRDASDAREGDAREGDAPDDAHGEDGGVPVDGHSTDVAADAHHASSDSALDGASDGALEDALDASSDSALDASSDSALDASSDGALDAASDATPARCGGPGEAPCVEPDGARVCVADAVLSGATCACAPGAFAVARRCVRGAVRAVFPMSGSYLTGRNVRFRWTLPEGLSTVRFVLCRTAMCTAPFTRSMDVTGTEVTAPVESGYGYWQLRTPDGATALTPPWFFVARGSTDVDRARAWPGVLMNSTPSASDGTPTNIPIHARHATAPTSAGEFGCGSVSTSGWLTAGGRDGLWEAATLAGDLDGDGTVEYAVSAPLAANGGLVQLRSPCRPSPSTTFWRDLTAPAGIARFGTSVAGHGDLDGDGFSDLVVTGYDRTSGAPRVLVYRFGASGTPASPAQSFALPLALPRMTPIELRMVGDVNGDDRADLVVSIPSAARDVGRALLWLGASAGLDPAGPLALDSAEAAAGARFGAAVAPAGDLDGDGLVDVAVGAPGADDDAGAVYVYAGARVPTGVPAAVRRGESYFAAGARCGFSVAGLGDTNGDGRSDLAVGCPGAALAGRTTRTGVVLLFRGQRDGLIAGAFQRAYESRDAGTLSAQARVGYSLAVRPLDRAPWRGNDTLLVGGLDHAWAWPASTSDGTLSTGSSTVWTGFQTATGGGRTSRVLDVTAAGDIDGDGRGDLALHLDTHVVFYTAPDGVLSPWPRGSLQHNTVTGRPHPPPLAPVFDADFNGDGLSDLVLRNAPALDLALREPWGTDARPTRSLRDADGTAGFGGVVAAADVDGDRVSDLLVNASGYLAGRGAVYVFLRGGASGGVPSSLVAGPVGANNFGATITNLGDMNGDGRDDVAVTSNDAPPRFSVLYGNVTGLDASPAVVVTGSSPVRAGDLNGDRLADVAYYDNGQVRVLFGASDGPRASAAVTVAGARAGFLLAGLGDVNGDGLGDLLTGAPSTPQLVLGHRTQPALDASATVPGAWVLTPVGDLNGDGAVELSALGDLRTTTSSTARDVTNPDAVARVFMSRVGATPYDGSRVVTLRLGPGDFWGAGRFTP